MFSSFASIDGKTADKMINPPGECVPFVKRLSVAVLAGTVKAPFLFNH